MSCVSGNFSLADEFERRAAPVVPSLTSNTKWEPIDALLAEELGLAEDDVYTSTVSKAGNLSVRAEQSKNAGASVVVVMWTGKNQRDLDRTVAAAHVHCADRDLVLVAARSMISDNVGRGKWTVRAIMPSASPPSVLTAAWPAATVIPL